MSANAVFIIVGAFFASWFGSAAMRRYALARAMLDIPNARSSHCIPTPRGGGVAFVISFLLGLFAFRLFVSPNPQLRLALALGGGIVALVGFRDDRDSLSAKTKFCWQLVASALAAICLGGWPEVEGSVSLHWDWLDYALAALVLCASVNLYNFMDGIDGLAISQSIFMSLAYGLLVVLSGGKGLEAFLLAGVCLGFCFLNWPPAKLFMGDAGSGFLGFCFGAIALYSAARRDIDAWPWLIVGGVFIVDSGFTLLRRLLTGQRWYEAHRLHGYQIAARKFDSHLKITIGVQIINVCWLLPLALVALWWPGYGWACLAIAWLPLVAVDLLLGAGLAHASSAQRPEQITTPRRTPLVLR